MGSGHRSVTMGVLGASKVANLDVPDAGISLNGTRTETSPAQVVLQDPKVLANGVNPTLAEIPGNDNAPARGDILDETSRAGWT